VLDPVAGGAVRMVERPGHDLHAGKERVWLYRDPESLKNALTEIALPLADIQEGRRNTHFTERPPP
jgi:hypothetical protein